MAKNKVRWGIVGCGDVAEVKSGPAFQKAKASELVAVMRRDGDRARDFAQRHDVPRWYADADELINDPHVDAVYVATPVGAHAQLALKVAAANKPAYIEKPMARSGAECDKIMKAFRDAGQSLFVAYYRRALPRFQRLKDMIDSGLMGRLTSLRYHYGSPAHRRPRGLGSWRYQAEHAGGGLFMDLGCHVLDVIDFTIGPLARVTGTARNVASPQDEVEDCVSMSFEVAGVPAAATWNFAQHRRQDRFEVETTEGSLELSVFGDDPIRLIRDGHVHELQGSNPQPIQQPLIQSIVDDILGKGQCPSTGESARRTSQVMDKVLASYYGGREDAFWQRPSTWPK